MALCDRDIVTDFWANDWREAAHKSSADQTHPKVLGYMEIDLYICGWRRGNLTAPSTSYLLMWPYISCLKKVIKHELEYSVLLVFGYFVV